ncbi:MAG: lytic transglycosylase catalytic [Candidatus Symbiopectobacterium sp. Dall1.0]|nr:lytic transglycosylase catalytic [Candidatus Symbiopectobacterium sp. Dall1.0]
MSGNADTIKDFLVSLGFDIDQAGANKFDAVLKGVTANVLKVGAVVEGAALSIVGFTTQIANGLDKVYWASQRTGASAQGIKALGYAAAQTGASAESALSALEGLSGFMRSNPGAEGFLNRLGVQTRDVSGKMRDTASIFTGVGQKLNNMPYYRARQYAQMLGIDENTLMAMRRGMNGFTADYQSMLQKTGFNADKAAAQSNKFMTSLTGLTGLLGILRDKIGSNLAGGLAGSLDGLRKRILDNFPRIEETLTKVVKGVLWFADAFTRMVYRLVQGAKGIRAWWRGLEESTKKLIATFGGLLVAWRVLNSAFLMSPIGLVTTLIGALALLYDDYQTWKEGGQSLIDWSTWQTDIDKAIVAIKAVIKWLDAGANAVGGWETVFKGLAVYMGGKWLIAMLSPIGKVTKTLLAFPAVLTSALNASGLYVIVAAINDAYEHIKAMATGTQYDQIVSQSEEMKELERLKRRNWETHHPDAPYPESVQHAQSAKHTQADRNNNPGNIRPVGGKGFRFFESALQGWEAMKNQLMRYFTGKTTGRALQTIQDIVSTWAPAGDNNDPEKYAQDVAKWMGVSPNAVLNLNNPNTMGTLMQSMARKEGYGDWNSPLAYRAAGVGGGTQVQQQNTYNIYGGSAKEIGHEVARQINLNAVELAKHQTGLR